MWNKFNIKIQLTIFMVVIICVVELSTLYFVNQYQKKENKKIQSSTESFKNVYENDNLINKNKLNE